MQYEHPHDEISFKQFSEDLERQPNFFVKKEAQASITYDDKQSVQTVNNNHITIDAGKIIAQHEIRSEYSGVRGGGRAHATITHPSNILQSSLNAQPMRPNTIHRALIGANTITLKAPSTKKKSKGNLRKNNL